MKYKHTEEQLIEILRNRYDKKGKMLFIDDLNDVYEEILACFGSRKNAFRKAGIPLALGDMSYTEEELLEIIRIKAHQLGRIPLRNELPQRQTIVSRFGSWPEAVKMAGLDYQAIKKKELLQAIIEKEKELGRVPRIKEMRNGSLYKKYFGSWKNALKMVGMKSSKKARIYSDEFLLNIIRNKAEELGRTPTGAELDHCQAIIKRFGNLSIASKKAGVKPRRKGEHL